MPALCRARSRRQSTTQQRANAELCLQRCCRKKESPQGKPFPRVTRYAKYSSVLHSMQLIACRHKSAGASVEIELLRDRYLHLRGKTEFRGGAEESAPQIIGTAQLYSSFRHAPDFSKTLLRSAFQVLRVAARGHTKPRYHSSQGSIG